MAGTNPEKPKKSFEFRMSKKVAELTQVVHMLFTRNHEKEVEIDALKKAYEKEIELAIDDARSRISKLEQTIEEQSNQNNHERNLDLRKKDEEFLTKEMEWQRKLSESERLLQEERGENQNLRDLLINAQGDIEKLRQGVTDELSSKSDEIRRRDKEVERLASQLSNLEADLKKTQNEAQSIISELQKTNEKLEEDIQKLHNSMENSYKARDHLMGRNKQLEHDMSTLKREFNKRAAEMANNQLKNAKNNLSSETNLELERLRREVQRYRLELSNRDSNFNRMFTDKQPVLVNQRNGHNSKQPTNAIYTAFGHGNQLTSSQSHPMMPGNINANLLNQPLPGALKDRHNTRASFMEMDRQNTDRQHIDRQATFHDRVSSSERQLQNGQRDGGGENRPQTHGTAFMHETAMSNVKDRLRQQQQAPLYGDDPQQLLPQQQRPGTNSQDRPSSSSLPSICSTPERRKPLVKPKPLPRELLYGK